MSDNERAIGRIEGKLEALTSSVKEVKDQVEKIGTKVDDLRMFRARVYGGSAVVALLISMITWIIEKAVASR
jgi:hypothetical protein